MNFNGYSLFTEVRNPVLRSYNRANTYLNIKDRHGVEVGKRYLKKFDRNGLLGLYSIMSLIAKDGFEQTRRNIMRANNA
jgi:hypothetical protein